MPKLTQQERIVAIMCINKTKRWWKPHEIMNAGTGDLFIGYEASARLSELASDHPDMIESKREGKFYMRRMRFETGKEWYGDMPKGIKQVISRYYKKQEEQ